MAEGHEPFLQLRSSPPELNRHKCAHALDQCWYLLHLALLDIDRHIEECERFALMIQALFRWSQVFHQEVFIAESAFEQQVRLLCVLCIVYCVYR